MAPRGMKTTPAMACMKTLVFLFTIIFLLIGIAILVVGVLAKVKYTSLDDLSTDDYSNLPWLLIAIGSFIVIVGLMGCSATVKGNTCLLKTYAVLLGLIFVCELGGAICFIVFREKVDSGFYDGMTIALQNYTTNKDSKQAFDQAQSSLHCCGVDNYSEWWLNGSLPKNSVPQSCCYDKTFCKNHTTSTGGYVDLSSKPNASDVIYVKGCHALIADNINENLAAIIGSMFGIAFFQVIGLILSCCLASSINSNRYELV